MQLEIEGNFMKTNINNKRRVMKRQELMWLLSAGFEIFGVQVDFVSLACIFILLRVVIRNGGWLWMHHGKLGENKTKQNVSLGPV